MAIWKAILYASAVTLGITHAAAAADLLPPPPPMEPVYAQSFGGWYIRGDVGVGIDELSGARSTLDAFNPAGGAAPLVTRASTSIGDSAIAGVGVGYQVNNWLRFDGTGEYRTSASYRAVNTYTAFCGSGVCPDIYSADVHTGVLLANAYFDVGTWYGVTPFVGAGVGAAIHKFSGLTDIGTAPCCAGFGTAPDKTTTSLAWAVMAGLGFNITPNLKLELSYRYLDMGTLSSAPITCEAVSGCFFERQSIRLSSNDIRVGFRYMFADYVPPAPQLQQPLIRKY
jgi:opacity protein-like surface antigen